MANEKPGLFSKVVKFVRNPATNWGDLDQPDSGRESSYSKQMLKEMIERKRRNDFVRKREFDMLRKMRRSELMAGQDPGARPSFFQSSMPSKPDDRATTLKKIDEIEAQMSMQWWKTKHGSTESSRAGTSTSFPMSSHSLQDSATRPLSRIVSTALPPDEDTQAMMPTSADSAAAALRAANPFAMEPTQPSPLGPASTFTPPDEAGMTRRLQSGLSGSSTATPPDSGASSSGFSSSKLFAIDVEEFAHDPELEEASIRFANGDDDGAEAGLREVLAPHGSRLNHDETWLTLFDLYRAIGRKEPFETAAIEFAGRFNRSAPQWISFPEAVGQMQPPASSAATPGAGQAIADWTAPSVFGTQSLAAMKAALGKAAAPWRINWSKLNSLDDAAVEPLMRQFTEWAEKQVQLRFIGADNLEKVMRNATPSGDKAVNPVLWKLRMEVLRVMHRPDEFELVALDYCVTYEVSPPSWDTSRCEYKPLQADGSYAAGNTIIGNAFRDSLSSGLSSQMYGDTQLPPNSSQMASIASVELAGHISGDAVATMDVLDGRMAGADVMVISCSRLIRVDFTAAGSLLNWVSARQAEGRQVQFTQVNRMVAAFFNVIGISEHARVMARID